MVLSSRITKSRSLRPTPLANTSTAEMASLKGEVAFVTGASRGIGRAVAISLSQQCCRLYLVARSQDLLEETADLCAEVCGASSSSPPALFCAADVCDDTAMQKAMDDCVARLGKMSLFIDCVGLRLLTPLCSSSPSLLDDFDRVTDVTFTAAAHNTSTQYDACCRRLCGRCRQRKEDGRSARRHRWCCCRRSCERLPACSRPRRIHSSKARGDGFVEALWTELRPLPGTCSIVERWVWEWVQLL